jgi:hypothetical protein
MTRRSRPQVGERAVSGLLKSKRVRYDAGPMQRPFASARVRRSLPLVLAIAAVGRAAAQPTPAPAPAPTVQIDEARLRELVDREVAQVLTDRAAREAADRAARDAADREATPAAADRDAKGGSGFTDTRLAFTLTNENLLAKPGETTPSAPGWRFGAPNAAGVLFFDNYDTRYSGFETLSHATTYRDYTSGHLEAEGALVVRIDAFAEHSLRLSDDGSYVTLTNWKDPTHKDPTRISLTAFPVSADRFRLGYSYRLSWGGNPEYQRGFSAAPGIKLQYDGLRGYAFVGAKSAVVPDPRDGQAKAALAALAGAGVDLTSMLRLEVNGGYFDRGQNALADVQNEKVRLYGASAQLSIHRGMPLGSSPDYRLYRFNPEAVGALFAPEVYPGGLSWLAQAEATLIGQTLRDPDVAGSTVTQVGRAADLNVRVKIDRIRLRFDLSYRDLAFILHAEPSLPSYEAFPKADAAGGDTFAAIGVDRNWGDWLTLGLIAGIDQPATLTSPTGIPGTGTDGPTTAVIHSDNLGTSISILPTGHDAVRQYALKGTGKVDFAKTFSVLAEVFYSHDGNQTRSPPACGDPQLCPAQYEYGQFHQLGVNVTLQARF